MDLDLNVGPGGQARFYGLDDQPIPWDEALSLWSPELDEKRKVGVTIFFRRGERYAVTTFHIVLNRAFWPRTEPAIYETMVFSTNPRWDSDCVSRYSTRGEAKAGHKHAVKALKELLQKKPRPRYKYRKRR